MKVTWKIPKWYKWKISFICEWEDFGYINIKERLEHDISAYVFLFKIMEDQFKDQPELDIHRFIDIFEASMEVNWKDVTEKQIEKMFWKTFTINIS